MGGKGLPQDPALRPHLQAVPAHWAPLLAFSPDRGRDRLTLEVLDNVLNAEFCEEGHNGH